MVTTTQPAEEPLDLRHSGIPPKGKLGNSKGELISLVVALLIGVVVLVAFWLEASG